MEHNLKRGQMYYISPRPTTGSEQASNRPAIVVSNDMANANSPVIEVVYLTTAKKQPLPTHVVVRGGNRVSIALCEQVHSVDTSRVLNYFGTCTEEELSSIDRALRVSLGLSTPEDDAPGADKDELEGLRKELAATKAQLEERRSAYDRLASLLSDALKRG